MVESISTERNMSSIYKLIDIEAPAHKVWEAVREWGAIKTGLVPGFVTDITLEPLARVVTFANGMTVREIILSVDALTPDINAMVDEASVIMKRTLEHNARA
jgi:hypothetical protein